MNKIKVASFALAFLFFGTIFLWIPTEAEGVEGQEKEVDLYLFSENGVGKLHTRETANHGDTNTVNIAVGSSVFFALNYSLQADLGFKSFRPSADVAFYTYLYGNSGTSAGHLNVYVRDGTTMTGGEVIASGDANIDSIFSGQRNEHDFEIYWLDDFGPEYQFDIEHYFVFELENDGANAITLYLDEGEEGDAPSKVVTITNPIADIEIKTEAYNLETSDSEDRKSTDEFMPNLPSDLSKMFISAEALNAFGTYDVTEFRVTVFDSDDNVLFEGNKEIEESDDISGTNLLDEIIWNYNDPAKSSEKHTGFGKYNVRVAAIDQQGNDFYFEEEIQMNAYGIYSYTPKTEQSVAVGEQVSYEISVRNSGDQSDRFTINPSETSDNWEISPETWTSNTLAPGEEQSQTFIISVSSSTEMVGQNTVVVFTGRSEDAIPQGSVTFELTTKTLVGADYGISLFFEDPSSGQSLPSLSVTGVAGDWNQYQLSIANQGQAADSVQLIAQEVPADWEVKFEYDDLNEGTITVEDIPRLGDGYNIANVTVWVKPAQGGDVDTASIKLIGISQGNNTKSATANLALTRSFGLSLSIVPQGDSGIFINKQAGQQFEVDLLLESQMEGDNTIRLYVGDNFPSGWDADFKENGAIVTEVSISGGESKSLDLFITVGSQAIYKEDGDVFEAYAQDISDSSIVSKQQLTVILAYSGGFELSSLKYRESLNPGDSYTFQLTIENKANSNDKFTISATSVPSGWRVLFIDGNIFDIEAGRSLSVSIKIEVSDEAKDGDQESITISVYSDVSNQEKQQTFVVDVEQGFTSRLTTAISDLWYIFVFFALTIVVGAISYNQQEGDWDDDDYYDETPSSNSQSSDETTKQSSDDDWDDWD